MYWHGDKHMSNSMKGCKTWWSGDSYMYTDGERVGSSTSMVKWEGVADTGGEGVGSLGV